MDRHYSVDDGVVVDEDDADVNQGCSNDPEPKIDFASDSYDFDCYGSLYEDYGVVLDEAIDGTVDMDDVVEPHPLKTLSFVERIRGHPQIIYGGQLGKEKYLYATFIMLILTNNKNHSLNTTEK